MARRSETRNQEHGWKLTVTVTAYTTAGLLTALRRVIKDRREAHGIPVKTKANGRYDRDGCAAWSAESELELPYVDGEVGDDEDGEG